MPTALARILNRDQPDEPTGYTNPNHTPPPPDGCLCHTPDGGPNPTCPVHPWWRRDPTVLQLADHPDGPWAAALQTFGGA